MEKLNAAQLAIISGGIAKIDESLNYGGSGMNACDSDEKPKPGKAPFDGGMAYEDDGEEYDDEEEEE